MVPVARDRLKSVYESHKSSPATLLQAIQFLWVFILPEYDCNPYSLLFLLYVVAVVEAAAAVIVELVIAAAVVAAVVVRHKQCVCSELGLWGLILLTGWWKRLQRERRSPASSLFNHSVSPKTRYAI